MIADLSLTNIIIVIISLVIAITVHEAVHAYVGYFLGDDTAKEHGRISLNPFRHIDPFSTILLPLITLIIYKVPLLAAKPVPFNPERVRYGEFGAAMIAVAGPVSNLVMAAIAAGIINLFQGSLGIDVLSTLMLFMSINIGLFIFNMIPVPPLDGSRLLYAFAPEGLQRFMASLENFGVFLIFTLILVMPEAFDFIYNIYNTIFKFLLV
jgi:Zn-dependent protease